MTLDEPNTQRKVDLDRSKSATAWRGIEKASKMLAQSVEGANLSAHERRLVLREQDASASGLVEEAALCGTPELQRVARAMAHRIRLDARRVLVLRPPPPRVRARVVRRSPRARRVTRVVRTSRVDVDDGGDGAPGPGRGPRRRADRGPT